MLWTIIVYTKLLHLSLLFLKRIRCALAKLIYLHLTLIYFIGTRIHFEEFNQLLNKMTDQKYDAAYGDMARFILDNNDKFDNYRDELVKLYRRLLVCFLLGNTDAHLKNFALFHDGKRRYLLTPMYDVVATSYYLEYQTIALALDRHGQKEVKINALKAKHLVNMGLNEFQLTKEQIVESTCLLESQMENTKLKLKLAAVNLDNGFTIANSLVSRIEKQWNASFSQVETYVKNKLTI